MTFWKKKREVELDERGYRAWLRAMCPDIWWFLTLDPEEQETLARLGDERTADVAIAIGAAVHSPEGASIGAQGLAEGSSGLDRVKALAVDAARRNNLAGGLGGLTERREENRKSAQREKDRGRTFMGMKPRSA